MSTTTSNGSTSTTSTTLVGRLDAAARKLLAKAAGVKVGELHDGHIADVQAAEQVARDTAAKDAAATQQVAAAMQGTKALDAARAASVMPQGLSIAEQCNWLNGHAKGVTTTTSVPFIGADAKGLSIGHTLPFHPEGWEGEEIATECDKRGTVDSGTSSTKLVGVKGTPVKKVSKVPGTAVGNSIRMLAKAGYVYNG